jgi:hypothetical protein
MAVPIAMFWMMNGPIGVMKSSQAMSLSVTVSSAGPVGPEGDRRHRNG